MSKKDLRELRRNQVECCLSSGLSIAEWCRRNSVATTTLFYWIDKFRKEEPGGLGTSSAKTQTSNWIELSKEELALKTALVPLSNPVSQVPDSQMSPEPIRALVNGVDIAIPAGTSQEDIICVFRAAQAR